MSTGVTQKTTRVYERRLPGGGLAAIDLTVVRRNWRMRRFWGELVIEGGVQGARRAEYRPLVVARATGASSSAVMDRLIPIAERSL
jgi:hypothetical protein